MLEHLTRIDQVRVVDSVLRHQGIHRSAKVLGDDGQAALHYHDLVSLEIEPFRGLLFRHLNEDVFCITCNIEQVVSQIS